MLPKLLYRVTLVEGGANNRVGRKAQSSHPEHVNSGVPLPSGRLHSPWQQICAKSTEAVLLCTWPLTTQVRLALHWIRDMFTLSFQDLRACSTVSLHSSSLGRPFLSQVTFRSSLFPGALHSRVTLHQPGVMDDDLTRISGRVMGSGAGETKERSIT